MAQTLTLGAPVRMTFADDKVVAIVLPFGAKWLIIQPEDAAAHITVGAADGAALPSDYLTFAVRSFGAFYVGDVTGSVGIAGDTGEVVQLCAKSGGM
jgi:hypothetical protein